MRASLRIATRKSPLALWQARHVASLLDSRYPHLDVQLLPLTTTGDRILNSPLTAVGGKGLFTKELERALLEGEADIAVHSMKDVTVELPMGLDIPVILEREDAHDILLNGNGEGLDALPDGARVGTASARRRSQLRAYRTDLEIIDLRGNVGTRLKKLAAGDYDAIVLAQAGLTRLGVRHPYVALPFEVCLPAIGQGAIGVQCRDQDERIRELIGVLNHVDTARCVHAERALNRALGGGCQLPIAGLARLESDVLKLTARVARLDGSEVIEAAAESTSSADPEALGIAVAERLLAQGADRVLASARQ